MKTYEFTVILDLECPPDEMADRLYEAGCDDCTCGVQRGEVFADFDRDADSLESAVASAVRDVKRAGYSVRSVRIESTVAEGLSVGG